MGIRFQDRGERDLFEQIKTPDRKTAKEKKFFLPRLKNSITLSHENIIFLAICFVMTCIISFSLGVEKGRHDIDFRVTRNQLPETRRGTERIRKREINADPKIQATYIIQLAAFKEIESAKDELAKLKREGYSADIKKSGSYYQLYIGNFNEEEKAQNALKKLKNRYKDCYIYKGA